MDAKKEKREDDLSFLSRVSFLQRIILHNLGIFLQKQDYYGTISSRKCKNFLKNEDFFDKNLEDPEKPPIFAPWVIPQNFIKMRERADDRREMSVSFLFVSTVLFSEPHLCILWASTATKEVKKCFILIQKRRGMHKIYWNSYFFIPQWWGFGKLLLYLLRFIYR